MKLEDLEKGTTVKDAWYPGVGTVLGLKGKRALIEFPPGSQISGKLWWDEDHIKDFLSKAKVSQPT